MDVLRSTYRRRCRFYIGDDRETFIVWYLAPEGATFFEGFSAFESLNNYKDVVNVGPEVGEQTDWRPKYQKGPLPYADITGDHHEGTADDFAGRTVLIVRPDGSYVPSITPPHCDARPALGLLGGETNPAEADLARAIMGLVGGDFLRCPPSAGTLGLFAGQYVEPVGVGRLGLVAGQYVEPVGVGRLGLVAGEWCGDPPSRAYRGGLAAAVAYTVTLDTAGGALGVDRVGSLAAAVAYSVSLAGAGSAVSPLAAFAGLFNSGVGADNLALPGECPLETHWTMNGAPPHCPEVGFPSWVTNSSSGVSRWLAPDCTDTHPLGDEGLYTFALAFTVAVGTPLTGWRLQGREAADDEVVECRVNGVATGYTSSSSWAAWSPFSLDASLLAEGANTIEFDVRDSANVDWLGFRCEFLAYVLAAVSGGLAAAVGYTVTLDGGGSVTVPPITGSLAAAVGYTVTLDGDGSASPTSIVGSLDAAAGYAVGLAATGAVTGGSPVPVTLGVDYWWRGPSSPAYQDAAGTTPATATGHPVANWQDPRSSSTAAIDATDARQPTLRVGADGVNGKTVLRLGVGQGLSTGLALPAPYSILLAYRCYNTDASGKRLIQTHDGGNYLIGPHNDEHRWYANGWVALGNAVVQDVVYILECVNNGTASSFYLDGVDITDDPSAIADLGLLGFGDTSTGYHEAAQSDLCEVGVWTRALNGTERTAMRTYLAAEWQ